MVLFILTGEKNAGLRRHLVDSVKQSYNTTTKDLHNISQQLHKSQASVMVLILFTQIKFNINQNV